MGKKYFNRIKENSFYIILLSSIVVITLILTVISINDKPQIVEEPEIDLNEPVELVENDPESDKVLEENPDIDMETVTNVSGNQELGDNLLIVKEETEEDQNTSETDVEETKEASYIEAPGIQEEEVQQTFAVYNGERTLEWPLSGDILMNFSMETFIYDETLDSYRTNDTLCIDAELGSDVKAVAEGRVVSIEDTDELGTIITLDHGDNWQSQYCQVENLRVSVNDIVRESQVLAVVAEPSIYKTALGPHVGLKVTNDGQVYDPTKLIRVEANRE